MKFVIDTAPGSGQRVGTEAPAAMENDTERLSKMLANEIIREFPRREASLPLNIEWFKTSDICLADTRNASDVAEAIRKSVEQIRAFPAEMVLEAHWVNIIDFEKNPFGSVGHYEFMVDNNKRPAAPKPPFGTVPEYSPTPVFVFAPDPRTEHPFKRDEEPAPAPRGVEVEFLDPPFSSDPPAEAEAESAPELESGFDIQEPATGTGPLEESEPEL